MIIDQNHKDFKKFKLFDANGTQIDNALSYDTETEEAELCLYNSKGRCIVALDKGAKHIAVCKVKIPFSFVVDESGNKIK